MPRGLSDIETDIERISQELSQASDDHPNMSLLLACLGENHMNRFQLLGELEDIQKAIAYMSIALSVMSDDNPVFPYLLSSLGSSHRERFMHLGEVGDIDKAIELTSMVVTLTPDGHKDLPGRLANLGLYFRQRFESLGSVDDLEKATEYQNRALDLVPNGHPNLPVVLGCLGSVYKLRFKRLGELDSLKKAMEFESRALALTPDGHPDLPNRLANLGRTHDARFKRLGDLDDIEKAIEYKSRALTLTPNDHPQLTYRYDNLVASHSNRFDRLGELKDLEKTIEYASLAVARTPDGDPNLPRRLISRGSSHSDRFNRLGELGDLEKAIEDHSRAVDLTPKDHRQYPDWLDTLGKSHSTRFLRLGELDDLEKALKYTSHALALTPDDHPKYSFQLASLGVAHSDRFLRLYTSDDIEKAIEYQSRALTLTPDGHPELPYRLGILGVSYLHKFEHLGGPDNLEKAIEHESRALALTPDGHHALPNMLMNLGLFHGMRFERQGVMEDLGKATEYSTRALALTPDEHPQLSWRHHGLAKYYFLHFLLRPEESSHLQDSLDSFRKAQLSPGSPRDKFRFAQEWARTASACSSLNCIEAYQTTIDLLPQCIWLGATTNQRYEDLSMAETLAEDAAVAAILASDYALALEWLEHTRCVVWTQSLMLRSPLDKLQSAHPDLGTRLQTVANQLHYAGAESRESRALSSGSLTPEQVAQQHRRLAKEYDDLISQTRTLPGFEGFLQPMKADALLKAAQNGPIVAINCHNDRCDALVILPGRDTVEHIPLPNFSGETARYNRLELEKSVRNSRLKERGANRRPVLEETLDFRTVLAVLWDDVVKPILDFLGYTTNDSKNNLPHITWCPTGTLSFLPLHAAGDYNQPRSRVFDYVISSYTPTLTALLTSTPSVVSCNTKVLAIGQPKTPGHTQLPGTVKELAFLKSHTQDKVEHTQLVDDQATTAVVLDAMEQHDWVHLACHAHQNVQDPTESGFFLHGGTLDLASINRRSFKNKGLAYLSACQTATGDKKLPDEAVHLASGMLMAGYSSVIATMWSVGDEDAPFVADRVYGQLLKDGKLGGGEAGRALHNAVAGLRELVGEENFERWVPYIHIGS
ncbi:unnamed protein product [Rhizoctonia solani]|uniref:CHAT domain-containing protein n=1 Tax=Rhizoctonia solani TaxID=456999 RepID=A0A8H2X8M4_9AGAM|nr:unnamed protein product [Rhizoctonia solani]